MNGLVAFDGATLAAFLAAFVRVGGFLQAAPLTGDQGMPPKLRAAAAAMIAVAVAGARGPLMPAALPVALPTELLFGLGAGFAVRLALAGIEAGGQLIGLHIGLGFAGHFDPMMGEESLATRRIAYCLGGLAFLGADGLEMAVAAVVRPAVDGGTLAASFGTLMARSSEVLIVAVRLAAPIMLSALVINLAAALASRAAPALNVFSVTFSLSLIVGGLILIATAPALVREVVGAARRAAEVVPR